MNKTLLSFLLVVSCTSIVMAQTTPTKKFLSKDKSFEISYPQDWELSKELPMGVSFLVLTGRQHDSDVFNDNVNVLVEDLKGNEVTSEEYGVMCKPMIRKMITDYKEVESKKIKLGTRDAYMLVYLGKQGIYALKYNQVILVEKGKAYIITYTCEPPTYNAFIKAFGLIANSIVIK
ncbi:MAG: PsbP-related protein [Bacteroidota bacterium]